MEHLLTTLLKPMVCFVDHAMALVLSAEMRGKETMQEKENFYRMLGDASLFKLSRKAKGHLKRARRDYLETYMFRVCKSLDIIHFYYYALNAACDYFTVSTAKQLRDQFIFSEGIVVMHNKFSVAAAYGRDVEELWKLRDAYVDEEVVFFRGAEMLARLDMRPDITRTFTSMQMAALNQPVLENLGDE